MDCSPSQDKSEEKHGTKSFPQCLGMGNIDLEAATIRALPKTYPPHAHCLAVGDGLPSASSGRPCQLGGYRSPPLRVLTILNKILPPDSTTGKLRKRAGRGQPVSTEASKSFCCFHSVL